MRSILKSFLWCTLLKTCALQLVGIHVSNLSAVSFPYLSPHTSAKRTKRRQWNGALGHKWWECLAMHNFPKQARESEYQTLIQCSAFDYIRPCFPHIFDQAQSLHEFLSQPQCALSIATFIGKVLEHRDLLLTFTRITWNVIFFGLIGHIWPPKTIIESIYLSLSLSLSHTHTHTQTETQLTLGFDVQRTISWGMYLKHVNFIGMRKV